MAGRTNDYTFIDDAYIPYINDLFTLNGITYGWIDPRYTSSTKGYADSLTGKDIRPDKVYVAKHGNRWRQTKMSLDADNINAYLTGNLPELSAFPENGVAASAYDPNSELVRPNIERYEYNDEVNKLAKDRELSARLSSYTPLNFLNTVIPMHLISPMNYVGAMGEAARGNDNFFLNALSGDNEGAFSLSDNLEEWAGEHPYLSAAGNLVGDIAGFGALSDTARFMKALNAANKLVYGDMGTLGIVPRSTARGSRMRVPEFRETKVETSAPKNGEFKTYDKFEKDGWEKLVKDKSTDGKKFLGYVTRDGGKTYMPLHEVMVNGKPMKSFGSKNAITRKQIEKLAKDYNRYVKPPKEVEELKDMGFDFNETSWFSNRPKAFAASKKNAQTFYGHMPEYKQIADDMINSGEMFMKDGNWYGTIDGETVRLMDPESYIVSKSKAFTNNGYKYHNTNQMSAVRPEYAEDFVKEAGINDKSYPTWTTNGTLQSAAYAAERGNGPVFSNLVGLEAGAYHQVIPLDLAHDYYIRTNSYGTYPGPVQSKHLNPITGDRLDGIWRLFGSKMRVKSLRGNNGNFEDGADLFSYMDMPEPYSYG